MVIRLEEEFKMNTGIYAGLCGVLLVLLYQLIQIRMPSTIQLFSLLVITHQVISISIGIKVNLMLISERML